MEQIVRVGDALYYGNTMCESSDYAYKLFREDYHQKVGKDANRRLNREGQRTDVLHWQGFQLTEEYFGYLESAFGGRSEKVKSSVIGIVCSSYCRTIDCRPIPNDDIGADEFIDWILATGSNSLVLVNRKNGLGRLNKRNKTFRK